MKLAHLALPAAAAVVALAGCGQGGQPAASHTTSPVISTSPAAVPSPSPSPLTAAQSAFIAALEKQSGNTFTSAEAQLLAAAGQDACNALAEGDTASQLESEMNSQDNNLNITPAQLIDLAEQDICPPVTLVSMSGSGIENSAPFTVGSGAVTATYTFNCSSFGMSGNFIATLQPVTSGLDYQSIANQLAMSGGTTTTVYPQDAGSQYYVAVNSECSWSITLTQAQG